MAARFVFWLLQIVILNLACFAATGEVNPREGMAFSHAAASRVNAGFSPAVRECSEALGKEDGFPVAASERVHF